MRIQADQAVHDGIEMAVISTASTDYETKQQRTTDNNMPLWEIEVAYVDRSADFPRSERIKVRVPSPTDPSISRMTPIRFGGLRAEIYPARGEKPGLFYVAWRADTFTTEPAPSTRPSESPKARVA
jgi:hypothetical protein